jgi:hypothetical protein
MPAEVIQLEGSPAELLGGPNATNDDDPAEEPLAETQEDDDATSTVTIHEVPRQLSTEEKEERRQLIRKVGRYRALFPAELADIQTTGLDAMQLEALRDLGQDVEFLVGTRRSAKAVRGMFLGSLQGVEAAGPYLGLQLHGLANVAASSEDMLSTVDEIAVKYESSLYVDPVARLGLAVVQLALAVDSHNRRAPTPAQPQSSPPPPPPAQPTRSDNIAAEQFSDL